MKSKYINTVCHQFIEPYLLPSTIAIDATMGTGKDTAFLAKHSRKVYSFDIQTTALALAQDFCQEYNNITYILDSHENMAKHINEKVNMIMFNLGYLPTGSKEITTRTTSTIKALENALTLLSDNGIISIICYPGHPEGKKEFIAIQKLLTEFPLELIYQYEYTNVIDSPVLFILENKRRP